MPRAQAHTEEMYKAALEEEARRASPQGLFGKMRKNLKNL